MQSPEFSGMSAGSFRSVAPAIMLCGVFEAKRGVRRRPRPPQRLRTAAAVCHTGRRPGAHPRCSSQRGPRVGTPLLCCILFVVRVGRVILI